jgi:hypothetical protein
MINIWFSYHFWAEIWRSERMGHSDSKLFPAQMSWVPWGFGDRLKDRIFFPSDNSDYYLFWSGTSVSWCFFVLNKLQSYRGQTGKADSNSAFADFGRPPKEWQGALLSTHLKGSQGKLLMHDLCLGPWCLASDLKLIDLLTHWPCCFVMFYTEAQENKGKKSFRLQCLPAFESSRKSHSEFVSAAFRLGLW